MSHLDEDPAPYNTNYTDRKMLKDPDCNWQEDEYKAVALLGGKTPTPKYYSISPKVKTLRPCGRARTFLEQCIEDEEAEAEAKHCADRARYELKPYMPVRKILAPTRDVFAKGNCKEIIR